MPEYSAVSTLVQFHIYSANADDIKDEVGIHAREKSTEIIRHALNLGINFFDTANGYSAGTSEEYLGRAIKKNVSRDKVVIASKVYFNEGRLLRKAIKREIDGTLTRLGTDYLDLYIIHRFDYDTPICSLQQRNMVGRRFLPWKIIITFCTGRMKGN